MQQFIGWVLIIFPGILYVGQVVSTINFRLAQKLGLQEDPNEADYLLQRAERYTAYWDMVTLIWMPVAGVLMVIDSLYWQVFALFGGAIYLDAAGREAVKILSFKHEGIKIGKPKQQKLFFSTYIIMAVLAVIVIAYSLWGISNEF